MLQTNRVLLLPMGFVLGFVLFVLAIHTGHCLGTIVVQPGGAHGVHTFEASLESNMKLGTGFIHWAADI